jgi:hypothetical protein
VVFGNATVYQPPDDNPDHGGGPIRRSPHVTVRNDEMVSWVLRTPHGVVREHSPGGVSRYVRDKKFLPDGRLVPRSALGSPATTGSGFGAIIFASTLKQELSSINGAVEDLNRAITNQLLNVNKELVWVNGWRAWRAKWTEFYNMWYPKVVNAWIGPLGMGGAYDQAQGFRASYATFLKAFPTKGGSTSSYTAATSIPPPAAAGAPDKPAKSGLGILGWIGLGTIVIGGGALIFSHRAKIKQTVASLTPARAVMAGGYRP